MELVEIMPLVGCGVAVFCMLTTSIAILVSWRRVKSFNSAIFLNMSFAFIVVNVFYAVAIDQTEDEALCTATAAILHYFLLVGSFLISAQALHCCVYVIPSCYGNKRAKGHIILPTVGWLIPAGIVGASIGITVGIYELEDYKAENYCWINLEKPIVYSLLGPAAGSLLVNLICLGMALGRTSDPLLFTLEKKHKLMPFVWNATLLLALEAVTWVFAGLCLTDGSDLFHYLFAAFNCLTGILYWIVAMYWIGNGQKQLRRAKILTKADALPKTTAFQNNIAEFQTVSSRQSIPQEFGEVNENDQHHLVDSVHTLSTGIEGPMSNQREFQASGLPNSNVEMKTVTPEAGDSDTGSTKSNPSSHPHSWSRNPSLADAAAARQISLTSSEADDWENSHFRSSLSSHVEQPLPQSYRTGLMRYT